MSTDYLTGFYFTLLIPGASAVVDAAFQEVSGLSKDMKTEDVGSGGENRFKYRLPSAISFSNLVAKRGVVPLVSPLVSWCSETLDNGLSASIKTKDIQVVLFNQTGIPCMKWSFINAYPVKWSAADLNSEKSSVLIESIEFAYQYFELDDGKLATAAAAASAAAAAVS